MNETIDYTTTHSKRCITLFIQAHGFSLIDNIIPENDAQYVTTLNFPGGVGRSGLAKNFCNRVKIGHNKNAGVCDVKLFETQLDMMTIEYIHHVYYEIVNGLIEHNNQCLESVHAFKVLSDGLPIVYANANIPYFHSKTNIEFGIEQVEPFVIETPYIDKEYMIYPNEHEECDKRTSDCKSGKCNLRSQEEQLCPEYGITVVHSSNIDDLAWTLAGIPKRGKIQTANLNQSEGHSLIVQDDYDEDMESALPSTYTHWRDKLKQLFIVNKRDLNQKKRIILENFLTIEPNEYNKIVWEEYNKINENNPKEYNKFITEEYNKISQENQYEIKISNQSKKAFLELKKTFRDIEILDNEYTKRLAVYDLMTKELDISLPISKQNRILPSVRLSDIIDIFINGMGFDHIYIIDPSCNNCDFPTETPRNRDRIRELDIQTRIRSRKRPVYTKRKNTPHDITINTRTIRKSHSKTRKRANTFGGNKKYK